MAVGLGGALGAMLRYAISLWAVQRFEALMPTAALIGTLIANAVGALLIGVLFVVITEKGLIAESWRPLLVVGFLGALTTFSTFSLETVGLLQQGEWLSAMVYVLSSVIICLFLTWAGIELARWY
ncbi:MAG TPA: fluoride efflux transporter CrcB [Cellvibrionales bacterium]|jgi:CrcB protein|nr:fluoride efflux transporter CrcB [Cellvibrionales bacterium]HAW13726.1 fluoride efflux transporter CrcB [Cellvibrionales bacterium]HCX27258.1 fluoride efflux transporter CrcB [Cellvibrionales bacterium]